jgi:DNA-binding NarL/FixJ family response regulator
MKKHKIQHLLIIEDHSIVRRGIKVLLNRIADVHQITEANTFADALAFCEKNEFDFIIMDVHLPGGDSTNMVTSIRKSNSFDSKILVFSSYEANIYAKAYLKAGADGYLNKLSPDEDFLTAVETILNDEDYVPSLEGSNTQNPISRLSSREKTITKLMVAGLSNGEIQQELKLKPSTISTYKNRIFDKLKVDNIPSLIKVIHQYDVDGEFTLESAP